MFRRLTYIHLAILIALLGACTTNQSPQPPPLDPQSRAQSDPKKKTVFVRAWTPPDKRLVTLGYVGDLPIRPELPNEPAFNTESYDHLEENPFLSVEVNPLSTFSIDVDTASYANVRRFITEGKLPPRDAVRLEELINYFDYDYLPPSGGDPFSVTVEVGECPWAGEHRLARIGLKAQVMLQKDRPPANLVFLLDVSGSMQSGNKLPLVKKSMRMLLGGLNTDDTVAIVVYAGAAGLVLPATPVSDREMILGALEQLEAGGSTAGGAGIQLAYNVARENLIPGGTNRVVLATDGDFNVGTSDRGSLIRLVQDEAKSGVFLTVLGFGMGNLKDDMLESLADKGTVTMRISMGSSRPERFSWTRLERPS